MPWISVAATRHTLRAQAGPHMRDLQSGAAPRTASYGTVSSAFIGAEPEVMEIAAEQADAMIPVMEQHLKLNDETNTENYLNLAIAATHAGADIGPRLERLLATKPKKEAVTLALRWIAQSILNAEPARPKLTNPPKWLRTVVEGEPADALDLVLIPDHPRWLDMQPFVLPLAMLLGTRTDTPFARFARDGGHPERRGEVLYERTMPRLAPDVAVDEATRATWRDFDAVERKEGQLRVYHYLGQRWHAPLVFQPDIDAMPFLHRLDLSWKLVEESLPNDQRERVQQEVKAGKVVHVIARDPSLNPVAEGAIENASKTYNITIEVVDFRTV